MNPARRSVGVFVAACWLAGCGAVYRYPEAKKEDSAEACQNGIDDDLDGRQDCRDPECAPFCAEHDALTCADRLDNDLDGLTDCEDSDCAAYCPEQGQAACADGLDNDLDGKRDCDDDGCAAVCHEDSPETCTDTLDNDLDGKRDCEDDGCADFCREHTTDTCKNGIDDDLDGKRDCEDPECAAFAFCREDSATACADGKDNDQDGDLDCADADCAKEDFCREDSAATCADGKDNDQDGKADCDDDDCKPWCREHSAATCNDGEDNDQDGKTDCDDPSCDGHCAEETPAACSDGRDNDGDGLVDASDPLCWPFSPPEIGRCATFAPQELEESFDDPAMALTSHGSVFGIGVQLAARAPVLGTRTDTVLRLSQTSTAGSYDSSSLGGIALPAIVSGGWDGFALSFSFAVFAGTKLQVGLVPSDLAPEGRTPIVGPDSAIVAVTLDGTVTPPSLALDVEGRHLTSSLTLPGRCEPAYCADGWGSTTLERRSDGLVLTVGTPTKSGTKATILQAQAPASSQIAPSRLVIWGGGPSDGSVGALVDDVGLRHRSLSPCGFAVPQLPSATLACQMQLEEHASLGRTVSVARASDGALCALVPAGATPTTDPTEVLAFRSNDGSTWKPEADQAHAIALKLPPDAPVTGAAVARDDDGERWLGVVAYRAADGIALGLTSSNDCKTWAPLADGPLLPADAEAPSYVLAGDSHQIYFTRPATDETLRTLWRASGPEQDALELEPVPLYEFPADTHTLAPVAVTRVGASDLALTYPAVSLAGPAGVGLLVSDDSATDWRSLPGPLLSIPNGLGAAFDSDGVVAAALSFSTEGGVLLYAGRHSDAQSPLGHVATGTAIALPAGSAPAAIVSPAATRCGDGVCDDGEACPSCPEDCDCPGLDLVDSPLDHADSWHLGQSGFYQQSQLYVDEANHRLGFSTVAGGAIFAYLPLDATALADFELSFDLPSAAPAGSLVVGVGSDPSTTGGPNGGQSSWGAFTPTSGVFAHVESCSDVVGADSELTPLLQTLGAPTALGRYCSAPPSGYGYPVESPSAIYLPASEARRRIVLRRERGKVTVGASADPESPAAPGALDSCSNEIEVDTGTPVGELTGIVIEAENGTGSLENLRLRRLGDPADCPSGEALCGSGQGASCVDTSSTPEHCGACFAACADVEVCEDGACHCPEGTDFCSGACVDLQTSNEHCGSCDSVCHSVCVDGQCLGESCATPLVVPPEGGSSFFTLYPTQPPDAAPCGAQMFAEAAFSWTPAASGHAVLQLTAGPLTALAMTPGTTCESYEACGPGGYGQASLTYDVTAGVEYRIVVGHPAFAVVNATLSVQLEAY